MSDKVTFTCALRDLINSHSIENYTGTPDYALARYLMDCLESYERVLRAQQACARSATKEPEDE